MPAECSYAVVSLHYIPGVSDRGPCLRRQQETSANIGLDSFPPYKQAFHSLLI